MKPVTKKSTVKKNAFAVVAERVSLSLTNSSETSFCLELHIAPGICVRTLPSQPDEGTRIELRAMEEQVQAGFQFIVPAEKPVKVPKPGGGSREDLKLVPINLQDASGAKKTADSEKWDLSSERLPAKADCT